AHVGEVHDPAPLGIERAGHVDLGPEGVPVQARTLVPLGHVRQAVGRLEGDLGEDGVGHGMPTSLWVWRLRRQAGWARHHATAHSTARRASSRAPADVAGSPSGAMGWTKRWVKSRSASAARSRPGWGTTTLSSSPDRTTRSAPALGLTHTQSTPGGTGRVPLVSMATSNPRSWNASSSGP